MVECVILRRRLSAAILTAILPRHLAFDVREMTSGRQSHLRRRRWFVGTQNGAATVSLTGRRFRFPFSRHLAQHSRRREEGRRFWLKTKRLSTLILGKLKIFSPPVDPHFSPPLPAVGGNSRAAPLTFCGSTRAALLTACDIAVRAVTESAVVVL